MLIQGLVDANYQFLDVCVGWPGNVSVNFPCVDALNCECFTMKFLSSKDFLYTVAIMEVMIELYTFHLHYFTLANKQSYDQSTQPCMH